MAEDGGIGGNTNTQGEYNRGREGLVLPQKLHAEFHILNPELHRGPFLSKMESRRRRSSGPDALYTR